MNWPKRKYFLRINRSDFNIIEGLETHLKENPNIKINIIEGNEIFVFEKPVLAHAKNGENGDPKSKIDAFYKIMENNLADSVDIAGFKFCYMDFNKDTDVKNIFNHYKIKMNEISMKYPQVKIIHYTVPLTIIQSGPKALVKKLLGKDIGVENNYVRLQFNKLLFEEFSDQSIFDIAKYESTYTNGKREFTIQDDENIYSLIPSLSSDGKHLSRLGKNSISEQYLIFLAKENNGKNN